MTEVLPTSPRGRPANPECDNVESLVVYLKEYFPEDLHTVDASDNESVKQLVKRLLHRLWRWES